MGRDGKQRIGMPHLGQHAFVGVHCTLRWSGGARGVDQDGEILEASRIQHLLPEPFAALHVVCAAGDEVVQGHDHRIAEGGKAFHVVDDDQLELRAARAHHQDLVELFIVFDKDDLAAAVDQQILHLLGGVGRINPGADAAGAQHPHIGVDPFGLGVRQDRGDVARSKVAGMQGVGDRLGLVPPLAPRHGLPDTQLLFAQGGARAALLHRDQEALGDGVADAQFLTLCHCICPAIATSFFASSAVRRGRFLPWHQGRIPARPSIASAARTYRP